MTGGRDGENKADERPGFRVVVCAIMKNEEPYILEWVAYYRLLGFDIMVADNGGEDGTSALLSRLDGAGVIRRLDFTWKSSQVQIPAYRAMLRYARRLGYEFAGFLDADEFFTPQFPIESLGDGLGAKFIGDQFAGTGASQLSYFWTCFGSTEARPRQSELVLERFRTYGGPDDCGLRYKSFVRIAKMFGWRNLLYLGPPILTPHSFPTGRKWLVDGVKRGARAPSPSHKTGRILHFPVKSAEEFQERRASRGTSIGSPDKYDQSYFQRHDHTRYCAEVSPLALEALRDEVARVTSLANRAPEQTTVQRREARSLARGVNLRPIAIFKQRLLAALRRYEQRRRR